MKIHPRTHTVQLAQCDIELAIHDIAQKHALTFAEIFGALANAQAKYAREMLRQERHPNDPDKPADLE